MKERPILFSAPMVRAIIEGRKTQTRLVVKGIPDDAISPNYYGNDVRDGLKNSLGWFVAEAGDLWPCNEGDRITCQYGKPGDRLWVRETWKYADWTEDGDPFIEYAADNRRLLRNIRDDEWVERTQDIWEKLSIPENYDIDCRAADRKWRPSIHMPRWASRITLEITGVRVERLNAIKEGDAWQEGAELQECSGYPYPGDKPQTYRMGFKSLWESINGKGSWDANPWVWAIDFKRVQP